MIDSIHIFDLDGVLVDSKHRYRVRQKPGGGKTIDWPFWYANRNKLSGDSLLPLAYFYKMLLLDPDNYVVIATARKHRKIDVAWIDKNLGTPNFLLMVGDDVGTPGGGERKTARLKTLFNLRQFRNVTARFVYEDNIKYLNKMSYHLKARPVFIKSKQGH
jgi:hypothetical protein